MPTLKNTRISRGFCDTTSESRCPPSLFTIYAHLLPIRRDEADIKSREIGVAFERLRVVGLGASASFQPTLGSLLNPWNIVKGVLAARHPPVRDILSNFEGVVRPSEMLCECLVICVPSIILNHHQWCSVVQDRAVVRFLRSWLTTAKSFTKSKATSTTIVLPPKM